MTQRGDLVDRRHYGMRELAVVVALLLNFGGIVWGAATLSASVTQLQVAVGSLNSTAAQFRTELSQMREDYGARLRILEDRESRTRP